MLRYPQQNHKFHSFIYIQVTAKDFLAFPSPSKLLQLGSGRAQALKEELGVSLLSVLMASSNGQNNKSTVELNNELIVQYFYQHCFCMEKDNHYVAVYIYTCVRSSTLVGHLIAIHWWFCFFNSFIYVCYFKIEDKLLVSFQIIFYRLMWMT